MQVLYSLTSYNEFIWMKEESFSDVAMFGQALYSEMGLNHFLDRFDFFSTKSEQSIKSCPSIRNIRKKYFPPFAC